ncbi:PREDICTED: uncharacterized protein LOC104589855 isoform X2 [Nelumbo nucifera]|uniref:Protein FATTY ACID EXPORT 4, chloroplastic n=2 Tax=Nelumbo nucifera TaxID=4432 RepID=A0A822Z6F2_NELNU|nr:PREDICTED: uncharacterized protein LOC104589855 isoform X2 [Nelumbo nucifera]DAD38979.1 TPA_asm: hypothetical protein HUJ06_013302 [Nelumbo nucifera]
MATMVSSLMFLPTASGNRQRCRRSSDASFRHAGTGIASGIRTGIFHLGVTVSAPKRKRGAKQVPSHHCKAELAELAPATSVAYGALLLGGGLFAYARSRSKGSLYGGLSGAALMAVAYYLIQVPATKDLGYALGFGSAFLFTSVFAQEAYFLGYLTVRYTVGGHS